MRTTAVTISELEVKISDQSRSAENALEGLISRLNELGKALSVPTEKLNKIKDALGETGDEAKTSGKSAEKATAGYKKFFKSIARIAGYRAIRTALKAITQGFREGIQNIALYSQAIGGVDASRANDTMSRFATMGLQIKNALGAALIPMLNALVPAIQKVADGFIWLTDKVARFFATLNGQSTYTVINPDYMVDYAKQLNKATGSAKELKRTILGFDEINALNSQSSGSGAGAGALDYSQMFKEAVNPWKDMKSVFEDSLKIVGLIGAGFSAWKIGSGVMNTITALRGMSKAGKVLLGVELSIIGVTLGYMGGADVANGNLASGFAKGAGGIVAAALGGTLIGSAMGRHPLIGLAVGLFVGLASFAVGFVVQSAKNRAKQYLANALAGTGFTIDDFSSDTIQAHVDLATEIRNKVKDIKTFTEPQALKDLKYARELLEEIFTLNGIEIKTPEQMRALTRYVEMFNDLNLDGIQLEFDKTTGKIKQTKDEIYKTIDALEQKIKLEVYQEKAKEAYNALIDAQEEINDLYDKQREYLEAIEEAKRKGDNTAVYMLARDLDRVNTALYTQQTNIKELGVQYEKYMKLATGATDDWWKAIKNVGKEIGGLSFPSYANGSWTLAKPQLKATGGFVPSGDLFFAGERAPELVMASPNGSEVVNMAQFERAMMNAVSAAGGQGGDWTIVVQDENGSVKSRQVITAAERANRRDGRTVIPVGVY